MALKLRRHYNNAHFPYSDIYEITSEVSIPVNFESHFTGSLQEDGCESFKQFVLAYGHPENSIINTQVSTF